MGTVWKKTVIRDESCGQRQGAFLLPDIHYAHDLLWQEAKDKCIQDKGD